MAPAFSFAPRLPGSQGLPGRHRPCLPSALGKRDSPPELRSNTRLKKAPAAAHSCGAHPPGCEPGHQRIAEGAAGQPAFHDVRPTAHGMARPPAPVAALHGTTGLSAGGEGSGRYQTGRRSPEPGSKPWRCLCGQKTLMTAREASGPLPRAAIAPAGQPPTRPGAAPCQVISTGNRTAAR